MTRTRREVNVLLLLVMLGAPLLSAQAPRGPGVVSAGLTPANGELRTAGSATIELWRQLAADSLPESQWLKGGIVGGVTMSLTALVLGALFDGERDSGFTSGEMIRAVLYGGSIGFGIGALIGGQFEK